MWTVGLTRVAAVEAVFIHAVVATLVVVAIPTPHHFSRETRDGSRNQT
jgi:hypothetical protein